MTRRHALIGVLALAVLATCGISAVTLYVSARSFGSGIADFPLINRDVAKATVTETLEFPVKEDVNIVIESRSGDVTVEASEKDRVVVQLQKTAWAPTTAAAKAEAEALTIETTVSEKEVELRFLPGDPVVWRGSDPLGRVDFVVQVPADTSVTINARSGDAELSGTRSGADISTGFGDLTVRDIRGAITAESKNGDVTLDGVVAGAEDVVAATGFGRLSADNISAHRIDLSTQSGDLRASELRAGDRIVLESSFGAVTVEGFRSDGLRLRTGSGDVVLSDGEIEGTLSVESSFGEMVVEGVSATGYELDSGSGAVTLAPAAGPLTINADFGEIAATEAISATLLLTANSGPIRFEGSLRPGSDHLIESQFGDIELSIPADSAFDVELTTDFGRVESELPITVVGEIDDDTRRGSINGGGSKLIVTTGSGDIYLRALTGSSP